MEIEFIMQILSNQSMFNFACFMFICCAFVLLLLNSSKVLLVSQKQKTLYS